MNITRFPRVNNGDSFKLDRFCYDDCIATIINSHNLYFQYLYVDIYETIFLNNNVQSETKITNNLKKLFNISKKQINGRPEYLFQCIVNFVSNNMPIIVFMDGYYCPWDWRFLEIHEGEHAFIIYDYADKKFFCADPFYKKDVVHLNLDYFSRGCHSIEVLCPEENANIFCEKDLNSIYHSNIAANLTDKCIIRSVEHFINCIEHCNYVEAMELLENIIDNRIRLASYMDFMISREYMKKESLIEWKKIIYRWEVLHAMMLKVIYGGRLNNKELVNIYSNILHDERCLQFF